MSVVFEAEYRLLQLQARSMALFLPEDLAREIVVIDNSARGMPDSVRAELMAAYGHLAPRVQILRPRDISRVPSTIGWRSQQVLKLCVAEMLTSDRYVVLDAKNHFVRTLEPDFFEAADGRLRAIFYSYEKHPLRGELEHVLGYLGLDPATHVEHFTATVTPFALDTGIVMSMIQGIEQRSGKDFAREFVANDLLEFFLYAGWIIANGKSLEDVYDSDHVYCPIVWPHAANLAGVQDAVRTANERRTPLFTVHRRALARLDRDSATAVAEFWTESGLFPSVDDAERFIRGFQRAYDKEMRMQRIRDTPHKLKRKLKNRFPRILA